MRALSSVAVAGLFGACMALTACATVPDLPPPERTRSFDLTKDQAWSRLIEFLAGASVPIRTIEKDSGVVYAERMAASAQEFLDSGWGRCSASIFASSNASVTTTVNVFMRESAPGRTTATVNVTHMLSYTAMFSNLVRTERCESTGYLEATVLDVIGDTQTARKPTDIRQLIR